MESQSRTTMETDGVRSEKPDGHRRVFGGAVFSISRDYVFIVAEKSYAEQIAPKFDSEQKWVSLLQSQEHCFNPNGFIVKDLLIIPTAASMT